MDKLYLLQHELIKKSVLNGEVKSYDSIHVESMKKLIDSFKFKKFEYHISLISFKDNNIMVIYWENNYNVGDCKYSILFGTKYYTVEKTYSEECDVIEALNIKQKYPLNRKKEYRALKKIGCLDGDNYMLRNLQETININYGNVNEDLSQILEKLSNL